MGQASPDAPVLILTAGAVVFGIACSKDATASQTDIGDREEVESHPVPTPRGSPHVTAPGAGGRDFVAALVGRDRAWRGRALLSIS